MFKNFSDAHGSQPKAAKGGNPTQAIKSFTHDAVGNVEERVLAAVEALGLEARPDVVSKVQGMLADFQTPKGADTSCGITVYASKVVARGPEAIAALS